MAENEIEQQSYDEALRCRDGEIAAMNRDYKNTMREWELSHQ